ncbi:transcriptional regulator GcvA [Planctomycetota bacterium]|nr:transcriptional regulator GcvA [Planctomycetota bacterium]
MDRPSLTALRAFETVARLGSFTLAAEELFVTQGAVSHQVRGLEKQLGLQLFERSHRRIALTAPGVRLSAACSDAFARLDDAVHALTSRPPDSVLTVSVTPSFATRWLVPRLEHFRERAPDMDVRISATDARIDPVREGVDLCIRYGKAERRAGLASTLLVADDVFPVCHASLTKGRKALRAPADLKNHVLLHDDVAPDDPDRPDWRKWLRAARVRGVKATEGPRFSHADLVLRAAVAGQGVALGRTTLVVDDLAAGRLVRPFETSFRSRFAYWIVTPAGERAREKTRPFRDWLHAEVAGE